MSRICNLSRMEKIVLANHVSKSNAVLAQALGISEKTIGTYKGRIKKKREAALKLIRETNPHKSWLYPKRRGE